jgi:tRNA isopentenyl-2-thiomethyl-A-37 hydroxylase MiaE
MTTITTPKEVINQAIIVQNEFLKTNTYWSLEAIVSAFEYSDKFTISTKVIDKAIEIAKEKDKEFEK